MPTSSHRWRGLFLCDFLDALPKATRPLHRDAVWPFFMRIGRASDEAREHPAFPITSPPCINFLLSCAPHLFRPPEEPCFLYPNRQTADGCWGGIGLPLPGRAPASNTSAGPVPQHAADVVRFVSHVILRPSGTSCFLMSATPDDLPDGWEETMNDNDWSEAEREAWDVLHNARPGDYVLWADRSVAMEVAELDQNDEGQHVLKVEKPRGEGHYEVTEKYHNGRPKFTSPIGRANDLHFVERTEEPRGLTEDEYADLVERLAENATDAFMRLDYGEWGGSVSDVTETWADDVAFLQWRGYKHHPDWEESDPGAIFESVLDHSTYEDIDDDASLKAQAQAALYNDVFYEGREMAEASIVASEGDYYDVVENLSHHTLDRYDRKNYDNARVAVRDTISDWVDDRQDPAYQSVIQYGNDRFDDADYSDLGPDEEARERAFDILDHEVWEQVQQFQRDRGEHDPTLRGVTYSQYQEIVDYLVGNALRRYSGRGFLRTTVQDVVEEWADMVEAHEWEGHRHRVYAAGDVEDIFASVAIHADADPFTWNPFSSDKERKMAVSALRGDVLSATRRALDNDDGEGVPVQADAYIQNNLVADGSYEDIIEAEPGELQQYVGEIYDALDGDEVGWTFVDEVIEAGGVVPQMSNDWVLIDYGVIRENERLRKLAWFDREQGALLILSGMANAAPDEMDSVDEPYRGFHVQRIEYGADSPEFLLSDVPLEDALTFVHDYVDAERADFTLIETHDDVFVRDIVEDEDLNAGGALDALIPNVNLPGVDDLTALGSDASLGAGRWLRFWMPELKGLAAWGAMWYVPHNIGKHLDGIRMEPNIHKKHGVGLNVSYKYGAAPWEEGVGGKADVDINVRPSTFSRLSERYAPKFVSRGINEGDIGKGAVATAGEAVERASSDPWGKAFIDEFGGSVTSFLSTVSRGQEDAADERLRREFLTELNGEEPDDVEAAWGDLAPEVQENYGDYVAAQAGDMTWHDLHDEDLGISGMLMRGLNAETVVGTAEFFNIDRYLKDQFTFYGSDFVDGEPPTFEEWQEERYGAGQPGGPESEAARMARYHKEVAAGAEPPDPYDAMGLISDDPDELGDFDLSQYDEEFGNSFDDVSEKFNEPSEDAQ